MAVETVQRRHRPCCRQVLVAMQASFLIHHFRGLFAIAVAFEAGQPFHPHAVDQLVSVAFRTGLLVREKIVKTSRVALAATYLLHEDVFGMTVRVVQSDRALFHISKVTSLACIPGRYTAMFLFDRVAPFDDIGDEHPILFEDAHGVACLAGEVSVLARLPGPDRLFHHMAGGAEFRVFPRMFIIAQTNDPPDYRYEKEQDDDRFLILFNEA
jgi:hypothetical protein